MDYFNVHTDVNACGCTRGCSDTVRESGQKVDSGRKIPCRTGESNLPQRRAGPTLCQLSYIVVSDRNLACAVLIRRKILSDGRVCPLPQQLYVLSYCHTTVSGTGTTPYHNMISLGLMSGAVTPVLAGHMCTISCTELIKHFRLICDRVLVSAVSVTPRNNRRNQ